MLILNENQIQEFNKIVGLNVDKIFISKNKKYYYAILLTIDREIKIRISNELASKFI
ncbi:MAG: hypothetical protein HFJ12_01655 [Bacilli bacterium]|nr:hypothetical protein [Bacilli bacterium]